MKSKVNKVTIRILQGDIYALSVDVVAHATDPTLTISPRLAAAGGPKIEQEAMLPGWCDVGSAVMTGAGRLPAQKLIHVVGPKWGEGSERGKLANATWETLRLVEANGFKSVALPAIATGSVGGYPVENCARVMMQQVVDFTFEPLKTLREIVICIEPDVELEPFEREFQRQLEDLKDTGSTGKVPVL